MFFDKFIYYVFILCESSIWFHSIFYQYHLGLIKPKYFICYFIYLIETIFKHIFIIILYSLIEVYDDFNSITKIIED